MAMNRSTTVAGTSLATANATRLISSCYVMPLFENSIVDNQISVIGRNITCENYLEFNQKLEFHYDFVYANQHEFAKSAYTYNLAPLVRDALRGENNMIIFGGVQSLNMHRFLLSQTVMQGLISQAAGQLLNAVNVSEEKMGSVTFSWYKLDCGSPEVITDVLKAASTITSGGGGGSTGSARSTSDQSSVSNSGLILREAGKARGMYVPGLWEIEIANGSEIETVITHVLNAIPQVADHSVGTSHTIMQLSVTNKLLSTPAPPPVPGSPGSHTYQSEGDFVPATGRITFLLLSNLSPADQQYLSPGAKPSPASIPPSLGLNPHQWFPWVDQLFNILQWLESRRASPPFHKSRLLLILREVLLRRQRASLMLFVHPSADQHQINIQWFKLFAFLSKDLAPTVVSFTNPMTNTLQKTSEHRTPSAKRTPSAPRSRPAGDSDSTGHHLSAIKRTAEAKRAATPTNRRSQSAKRGAGLATSRSLDFSDPQTRRNLAMTGQRARSQDDYDLPVSQYHDDQEGELDDPDRVYMEEKTSAPLSRRPSEHLMQYQVDREEEYIEDFAANQTQNRSRSGSANSNRMTFPDSSPVPSRTVPEPTAMKSSGVHPLSRQSSTQSSIGRATTTGPQDYVEDFNNHEAEAALTVALEASRNEAAALKIAYNYANDKYNEMKSAYDKLIAQLKEEGSMLEKRDKERYKHALKDLKDYEIYKEVMETAMMRLQNELENLAKENNELRATKAYEEKQIQKQKNFSERYSKDLVATKKKLAELETKYAQLEKQNKHIIREKEAAVAALAQTQGHQVQKVSQWQETAAIKQREVEELQKKLKNYEERCKALEMEKESILSTNNQEIANLRAAHSKALETLMGYQEENDVLRSAVVELSSKTNTSTQNSRNNSLIPSSNPPISLTSLTNVHNQSHSSQQSPSKDEIPLPTSPSPSEREHRSPSPTPPTNSGPPTSLGQKRQPIKSTTNYI